MSTPTTEEARELAKRWADEHHGLRIGSPMRDPDRERLYAWVRERLESSAMPGVFADALLASGLAGEREVLAYCVGKALGGAFEPGTGGWHSLALTLCEAAGWPS